MQPVHLQAVELLLGSVYKTGGGVRNAYMANFTFGAPGAPAHDRRTGTTIWFRNTELVKTALFVREHGAAYLRDLPMEDLQDRLSTFMTENYGHISRETFGARFAVSYAEHVSAPAKTALAEALAVSDLFVPGAALSLYPLTPFEIQDAYVSSRFFLVAPGSLEAQLSGFRCGYIRPDRFPPFAEWSGKTTTPKALLGVRSPAVEAAEKSKAAILGALALLPHRKQRFMFTRREVASGLCIVTDRMTMRTSPRHTPSLSDDITLTGADHGWLNILARKLDSGDLDTRRQIRALEYFYRAWGLGSKRERFPLLIMAIEALYSTEQNSTRSVVDAVGVVMGATFPETRLRLLLGKLRASVIHGRSPEVYDAEEYFPYFEAWESDPMTDLELIAARCLQQTLFEGALVERPHPYADLVRDKTGVDIDAD